MTLCAVALAAAGAGGVLPGCTSAVDYKSSAALSGKDLVTMTDAMAAAIAADPEVNAAYQRTGPLRIVVTPVVNKMRAEILPGGQARLFTARVRFRLAKMAPDKFQWVINRVDYFALREKELDVDPGPNPDAINPEYALTATFRTLTDETRKRRDAFYVCTFELTSLVDRTLLWSDSYELKKEAVKEYLD